METNKEAHYQTQKSKNNPQEKSKPTAWQQCNRKGKGNPWDQILEMPTIPQSLTNLGGQVLL